MEPECPDALDYEASTVGDIREFVDDCDDPDTVSALRAYEAAHKSRKTALRALDDRLEALPEPSAPSEDDATIQGADGRERIRVRNPTSETKHLRGVGGVAPGEVAEFVATDKVREYLRRGDLQYVSDGTGN